MKLVKEFIVPAGDGWIHTITAGQRLKIVDLEGNQAADTLFYSAADPRDSYCAVTTISAQRNIYLTTGSLIRARSGKALLRITDDTCGRHDTLGGACSRESNMVRYDIGKRSMHACRQTFLKYALSRGLGKRDIPPNINFFMNVPVTPEGKLTFEDGISGAGKYVELEALTDSIALISNCPQLNNPCNAYNPTPVCVEVWE